MKLKDRLFGFNELDGRKLLECMQYRIMNLILCVIHGIPLKRDNQPGKNCAWIKDINENDRDVVNNNRHYMNSIDTHKSYRSDQRNHYLYRMYVKEYLKIHTSINVTRHMHSVYLVEEMIFPIPKLFKAQ